MALNDVLNTTDPVIMMLSHGETLSADVSRALDNAAKDGLKVVRVNVDEDPEFGKMFDVGKHPVLLTWHCGEVISRRSRPWGTDATEIVNTAKQLAPVDGKSAAEGGADDDAAVIDKPVIVTDATFKKEVLESKIPVLVDFWADWCGPCRMVAPILEKLAKEMAGKIHIAKVDVDANPMLSQTFQIRSIPTMMFVKNGKIVGQSAGAAPENAIRDAIKQLIALKV